MSFCQHCGGEVQIGWKACPQCANPIVNTPQPTIAPQPITPQIPPTDSISYNLDPIDELLGLNPAIQDSVVGGNVGTTTNHHSSTSMQVQDTVVMGNVVQNTYVTQTVNEEMLAYVISELQNLRLNVDLLRDGLETQKKPQIKDKNLVNRISQLNETVMNAELSSGAPMLDKEMYEKLSTVALSADADGAGYMTHSYGLRVEDREEKFRLAKRKARLGYWCMAVATHRSPEGYKNYIEAAEIYLETRDDRILQTFTFHQCTKIQWPINRWLQPFNDWITKLLLGRLVKKYELKALKDPTVPNWSEINALRIRAKEIHLQVKSARKQPKLLTG